ncbi:MAG: hypothetical protein IKF95_01765, partial [Firmicutes bacterium]|nr:hypothetical protein [Bacillota bacterium]
RQTAAASLLYRHMDDVTPPRKISAGFRSRLWSDDITKERLLPDPGGASAETPSTMISREEFLVEPRGETPPLV